MGQCFTSRYSAIKRTVDEFEGIQIEGLQEDVPKVNDFQRIIDDNRIEPHTLSRKDRTILNNLRHYAASALGNEWIDERWYGWEALHYAAWTANPSILRDLLLRLPRGRINTLTYLSENALHIILAHGIRTETFTLSRQNGLEEKVCKFVTRETDAVIECVRILLDHGIDVNHSNFWNETPLVLAIRRKYVSTIRLLPRCADIDLDSCEDPVSGKTARDLLKGRDFGMLPKHATKKDAGRTLFQLLKSGDEESFLRRDLSQHANAHDGDSEENSSCTLLQYCFRRSYIVCTEKYRKIVDNMGDEQHDMINNKFVEIYCKYGMVKCVEHLLDNGAQIDQVLPKFRKSLLELATVKGFYPFLCVVLGHQRMNQRDICQEVLKCVQDCKTNENNTLAVLLNRVADYGHHAERKTVLETALLQSYRKISNDNLLHLLNLVGNLSIRNHLRKFILEEIEPDVIDLHLDECVDKKPDSNDIVINYDSFHKDNTELQSMQMFMDVPSLNNFINHFVFKILVNRKWNELKIFNVKWFYINLFIYFFLHLFLHVFILMKFDKDEGCILEVVRVLCLLLLGIFFGKEMMQLLTCVKKYLKSYNNWFELVFIGIVLNTLLLPNDTNMVLSVVTANLVLLLHLERVPRLTQYILILGTVTFYLKYILFYFIQFVSFAICFYILLHEDGQSLWKVLPDRVFQTLIQFTGNLDYMTTKDEFGKHELLAKMVFTVFTIFMAIILNNLLMGLLVTDMGDIKEKVKLSEQMRRTQFVVQLEDFLNSRFLSICPRFVKDNMSKFRIFDDGHKTLLVDQRELNKLDEEEKDHLDEILARKVKRKNLVKKLYCHIRMSNTKGYYL